MPVTAQRHELAQRLSAAGMHVDTAEFIAIAPASDPDALAAATLRWCHGAYAWMAVTSRNAVLAMSRIADDASLALSAPQPLAKVATVGEATLQVCEQVGLSVDLVPSASQNARGIVADFPEPDGDGRTVLVPVGNLASPVLARGLERKGWTVESVEAYRTVDGPGLDADVQRALSRGAIDVVVLTSGSVAERLARACPQLPSETMVVAIGKTTQASAVAAGMTVSATATHPSYDGIVQALVGVANKARDAKEKR